MTDSLIHFPLYVGDAFKKFIEYPSLEERGAWISIVVAMIHNDGELPNKDDLYRHALIFNDDDKQCLSQALAKFKKLGLIEEVNELIYKQKQLRKKRQEAGRKGGAKSPKKQAMLKQSESESESELNTELESSKKPKAKKVSLSDLSVNHVRDWLAKKRTQGKYIHHNEHDILETFRNYCESKEKQGKPLYENYIAAYKNAFEWDRCQPKAAPKLSKHQRARIALGLDKEQPETPEPVDVTPANMF